MAAIQEHRPSPIEGNFAWSDLVHCELDPNKGTLKWKHEYETATKLAILAKGVIPLAGAGALTGALYHAAFVADNDDGKSEGIVSKIVEGIKSPVGVFGGLVGAFEGARIAKHWVWKYEQDLLAEEVEEVAKETARKAENVFQTLFQTVFDEEDQRLNCAQRIVDPISLRVIVTPVKTICQPIAHIFDYNRLLVQSLNRDPRCPSCKQPVTVAQLQYDLEAKMRIINVSRRIFPYLKNLMEADLDQGAIAALAEQARKIEVDTLLQDTDETVEKIRNQTLSNLEAYVLHRFLRRNYDIYNREVQAVADLYQRKLIAKRDGGRITLAEYQVYSQQVTQWERDSLVE